LLDRARPFLLLAASAALAACGGGNGDAPTEPLASMYGDGARIPEVVAEPTWLDPNDPDSESCSYPADRQVYVTGVTVVAIDRFDETDEGAQGNFYIQDTFAQEQYEPVAGELPPSFGVTVYAPSFSPPDLRLAAGDVADLLGQITEFPGPSSFPFRFCRTLPELSGTMTFRFEGGQAGVTTVTLDQLRGYEAARRYLGMLVRVEDVQIAGDPQLDSSNRYTAALNMGAGVPAEDVVKIANELYDLELDGPPLADGVTFAAVTGVVTYFYGFKIVPRSPADFEL
jgi:hypothetical protein